MLPTQPFVLFLLSSATQLSLRDGSQIDTGIWAEELLTPWHALRAQGWPILLATPNGLPAQIDPQSLLPENLQGDTAKCHRLAQESQQLPLSQALSLPRLVPLLDGLRGIFIPGGNGPLEDLPNSPAVGQLLALARQRTLPVATLCHGSAALLARPGPTQDRPFAGFRVSCFQKAEEEDSTLAGRWPYHLQDRLREARFAVVGGRPWQSFWVADGNLLSGQNPASALALVAAFAKAMEQFRQRRRSTHGY
ncbi:MAG: type 1 glutamine amidotransferase domain-containing protein [Acidithiobacillus sp.]|nr:type 1 glutamine amidotransferase domain-containing protein [Acidithiobacillus sp.]